MKVTLSYQEFDELVKGYNYHAWLRPQPYDTDLEGVGVFLHPTDDSHQFILIQRISEHRVKFLARVEEHNYIIYERNIDKV